MAKCPNCGAKTAWDAASCVQCKAVFPADGSGWIPVAEDPGEAGQLARRKRPAGEGQHAVSPEDRRLAIRVAWLSLGLWLVSLVLPCFTVSSRSDLWLGYAVFITGILFGWAVHGWAAYANLFLFYVQLRVFLGKEAPFAAAAMVFLALTTPFWVGVIRDEGSGSILPVASWGWGAVVWFAAIFTAAIAAAVQSAILRGRRAVAALAIIGLVAIALLPVRFIQSGQLNEQERELYLRPGTVFVVAPRCGVPFNWPEKSMLTADDPVELEIDPALRSTRRPTRPYLSLPRFLHTQEGGFRWRTYPTHVWPHGHITVRSVAAPTRYALQATSTSLGATVRLVDRQAGATLYEQELRTVTDRRGTPGYCPHSTSQWEGLARSYDRAILRAVGQEVGKEREVPLKTEDARELCEIGDADIGAVKGLRDWDGHEVLLEPESMRNGRGFCSTSYKVLASASTRGQDAPGAGIFVFDRRTVRPLAVFIDPRVCPVVRCDPLPKDILKGVRIEGDSAVLETTGGEIRAPRYPQSP